MEYTQEQYKAGDLKADYSARHFKSEEALRERILYNVEQLGDLPHSPSQHVRGDKVKAGAMATRLVKKLAEEGLLQIVPGPRGGQYIVRVSE